MEQSQNVNVYIGNPNPRAAVAITTPHYVTVEHHDSSSGSNPNPRASVAITTPHYVRVEHQGPSPGKSVVIFVLCMALVVIPFNVMVIGAVHINDCPQDTRLGHYMVIQGLIMIFIPMTFGVWNCVRCVEKKVIRAVMILIVIFNIIWFIVGVESRMFWMGRDGTVYITQNQCKDDKMNRYDVGFAIPIWACAVLSFAVCICVFCCSAKVLDRIF